MKIIKSFRKSIIMRIDKNWELIVRAPHFTLKKTILDFVEQHKDWIDKQKQNHFSNNTKSELEIKELKKKAKNYIPQRVLEIALQNWFKYNNIRITSARTRWWSCTSQNNLNFSFYLIWSPEKVIDYVIIHELAHLKQMNHSKKFRTIVENIMPDYKKYKKWLRENGNKLLF